MMKQLCVALTFLFTSLLQAQSPMADSLERVLPTQQGSERAITLYNLVSFYNRSDHTKLSPTVAEAKKMLNDPDPLVQTYLRLIFGINFSSVGKNDSMILILEEGKQYASQTNNAAAQIRVAGTLGRALISTGKAEEGLKNLFEGLDLLKKNPDKEFELKIRTNVTFALLELKQYQECINFSKQSLALITEPKFEYIAVYYYNNAAASYGALGYLDSARYMIERGMVASKATNDTQSIANAYFILGTIYAEAGDFKKAIEQYEMAKPYREKVGNPHYIVSDLYSLSSLYYKSGDYAKGIKAGEEALALATQHNLLLKFENTYLSLAQNYEGFGNYKKASNFYQLWAIAKDSIYKNSSASAIAEMKTKYETEKKEQQLLVQDAKLSAQRTQLQRTYVVIVALAIIVGLVVIILLLVRSRYKRKQLVAAQQNEIAVREAYISATIDSQESERKRVAQDLHDGMGQLISALRMTLGKISPEVSQEQRVVIVEQSEKIVNDMYREVRGVAFNLMPQTLIQHGLVPALQEMALRLNESGGVRIHITNFAMPNRLPEIQEISLYRIIQEWTNNILKYANAAKIEINLVADDNELSITIEDNGQGFDAQRLEKGSGNGWKNIQSRVGLLKGSVLIDTNLGRTGTTLILQIPRVDTSVEKPLIL